jgi:hypothetical protein
MFTAKVFMWFLLRKFFGKKGNRILERNMGKYTGGEA